MEYVELISAVSPVFLGFVVLVLSIGKLMSRMDVVEDKIKTLFELWNKFNDR